MRTSNRNYAATVPFVEALANLGLRHVAITPGSRNTPLAFAFAANGTITDTSHHDERSAAFFALGMAKATGKPVALVSTSGTAAAEYLPAIVEAKNARVPLIVLTADRPPELRDVGSPQTINQSGMYGGAVKRAYEAPVPDATDEIVAAFAALAGRAWSAALDTPAGPVHINFPFRDPMAPTSIPGQVPSDLQTPLYPSYFAASPLSPSPKASRQTVAALEGKRVLIVAGPTDDPDLAPAIAALADAVACPVIADPLSGLRTGGHSHNAVVASGDWLARRGDLDGELLPEVVLRFGAPPTSKSLNSWLTANRQIPQILVDDTGWRDPGASASTILRANGVPVAHALADAVSPVDPGWLDSWRSVDDAIASLLDVPFPSEPAAAQALNHGLPDGSLLYVASSMPIRIVDGYFRPTETDLRILGNRGANGIDGFISSALGAATGTARPTFAYCGDLSLLHDLTALVTAGRLEIPLTMVLVNNDGGGIFHLLPQVDYPEWFERHLGTPHGLDFARISDAFGIEHHLPTNQAELAGLISTPANATRLIEIQTDRAESADLLREMWNRVAGLVANS
jgi:2-succinyl-5-enolpyruvyl-6-hydroxy-3-cyclohexene-1-carboxylate synthase